MRTAWRSAWLWLCLTVFGHRVAEQRWEGATPGWSPVRAVDAVERTAVWDTAGWYTDGVRDLHVALDKMEHGLWSDLDDLLAYVYAWRDAEVAV